MPARLFATLLVCGVALPSFATTYDPVTLADLVTRADVIFVGEVVDVRPYPVSTRDGSVIKTRVVFRVQDLIAGTSSALEVFDFFGGEFSDVGMTIAEMPRFTVGDRRVMFARRERSINPIVGFRQGLFQVQRDSRGVDRVLTLDGAPLGRPENLGTRASALPPIGVPAMPLTEFVALLTRVSSSHSSQPAGGPPGQAQGTGWRGRGAANRPIRRRHQSGVDGVCLPRL